MADNKTSIVLSADDKTKAAFESARRNLDKLTGVAGKANTVLSTLGVGAIAGGGLVAFAKAGLDAADNLNDLSQQIGVSVEKLAGYRLAAEQSGTSLEGMARSSQQLAKNIAEGDPLLAKLGVTSRNVDGAMAQLADVFAALPDGAEKTAIAMKLMGKSGADMIPMLNGGGDALRRMIEEGQRLNPITKEMAENADRFNDEMAKLKITTEAASVKLGGTLAKAFNDATEAYKKFRQEHSSFVSTLGAIGAAVVSPFDESNAEKAIKLQEKRNALIEQAARIQAEPGNAEFKAASLEVINQKIRKLGDELEAVWKKDKLKLLSKDQLKAAKIASDGAFSGLLTSDDAEKLQKTMAKAFDTKILDDYLLKFQDRRAKITAEYAKLKADLTGPDTSQASATPYTDLSYELTKGRGALAAGDAVGAGIAAERAKAMLASNKDQLGASMAGYFAEQVKAYELSIVDAEEKTAIASAEIFKSNLEKAAQEVAAMDPVHVPLAVDAITADLRAGIEQFRRDLEAKPLEVSVRVVGGASAGQTVDISAAALKLGGR